MKINFDYYKEELDLKQIPEEFEEIHEKVYKCNSGDFSKTLDSRSKIKNILALSEIRENILNWYPFKENSKILEMNANYGEITGLLCSKALKVVSIEQSKKYAEIIEKRFENKENLELYVGNYENIKLNEKFDYIVILGMEEDLKKVLEYAKFSLNEDGTILLAVNNKFGVKSWITTKEESKVTANSKNSISINGINKLLNGMKYKFYYPLPDYKMPNIIYTENSLPTLSNIYRDITYKDENVNFKEVEAFKEIINDDIEEFKRFANSFLIEISNNEIEKKDIRFISFSNMRKDEYRIKTIVKEKNVEKTAVNKKAILHIENVKHNIELIKKLGINTLDLFENEKIISKYQEGNNFENDLIKILKEEGKEAFIEKIDEYEDFLKLKLELLPEIPENNIFSRYKIENVEDNEKIKKLLFVKHGLWDLIFQNCFIIDGQYYFYDQEWYEENIPVDYILYRAILYFNESKKYITDEEIFERLNILEFIPLFKKLDDKLQEKTRKTLMWNIHTKEELQKNKYTKLKQELNEKNEEIIRLKLELENTKNQNKKNEEALHIMQNSISWKITKPLRKLRGH